MIDSDTRGAEFIDESTQAEAFLGVVFFNDNQKQADALVSKPYIRLAHGWGNESNLSDIMVRRHGERSV